jgi:hypothetical protein
LVIGGGGQKPKRIRKLQDSAKLKEENYLLRNIVKKITKKMKEKDIQICQDDIGDYFDGDLNIVID